jgi:hypothetical protein
MTEISATRIKKAVSSANTPDGKYVLISLSSPDDTQLVLALPTDQIYGLIDLAAGGLEACMKAVPRGQKTRFIFPSSSSDVEKISEDGSIRLTMTFGGEGKVSFRLEPGLAERLGEALLVATGNATVPAPGTRGH